MAEAIKVEHIVLKVKDVELELTTKEAAELLVVLKELFDKTTEIYPQPAPHPIWIPTMW